MASDSTTTAFHAGRRQGLAVAALATSALAFISLLGAEKAILAVVLAIWAMRESPPGSAARRVSQIALAITGLYLLTYIAVIVLFHDKIATLAHLLQQLG